MCGIFLLNKLNNKNTYNKALSLFNLGKSRGPDNSILLSLPEYFIGFHRLSINGLNDESNQPFIKNNVYVICNGEIYNFKELYNLIGVKGSTNSDCEIIIDLYLHGWTIDKIVKMLDGVFAFIIYDLSKNKLYAARDPFGIRPLFYVYDEIYNTYSFSSELKQLNTINLVKNFPSGYYYDNGKFIKYYILHNIEFKCINNDNNIYNKLIEYSLLNSVKKRLLSDRPIACLLSGGLDSSLICSIVSKLMPRQKINTFSIGLPGSTDLKYAKIVSNYLETNHTEVILTEDEFFNSIPEVIDTIGSYDTTTVRASVGNYLISKYISENTDFKVIFNGDGSDELTGGYLYFHKSPNKLESHFECIRLLENIYNFDVLRSDRCISSCGLEPRTPFLDKSFVNLYLSIPIEKRFQDNVIEKKLLRDSFKNYLPDEILYRKKEAFSDGVSAENNSWYKIIQKRLNNKINLDKKYEYLKPPLTIEQKYYRDIFDKFYLNQESIIPYYWMPKWSNTNDPSARTLD